VQARGESALSRTLQQAWLRRGLLARLLLPIAALYALTAGVRKRLYRHGVLATQRLTVPVVVVGNLVVGGAGKTPAVIAVVSVLRRHGYTPGILSRGYARGGTVRIQEVEAETPASECGDEPKLLSLRTGAPVMVGRDRTAAGRALLHRHPEVDVIVSDDGLQHHALARDVQVILFDERGVGNGWLLPSGPLREPLATAPPPHSLVLYNAARESTPWPGTLGDRSLAGVVELGAWWRGEPASLAALGALRGRRLVAAAGIAHPERFFLLLRQNGLEIEPLPLPDHCPYTALPWSTDARDVVVTEKDAVKIEPARAGATRVWVAALDFRIRAPFETDLIAMLPGPARR
jgi:tetraacyldisaccharide 4'-kinase